MDWNAVFDGILTFLGNYGFIIIIVLGLLHPIIDNPWAFFTMSLSITLLGPFIGFVLLLSSNILGILILYFLMKRIDKGVNSYFYQKKVSGKALKWLEETESWRHIIVIGLPLIPTFFLKIAFPFTKMSFKKYFFTVLGAYIFLYAIYSMVYYGVLSFLTDNIPSWLGIILLLIFSVIIYFSKSIKNWLLKEELIEN